MTDTYTIITTTACVKCDATKRQFTKYGLPFEAVSVDDLTEEQQARFDREKASGATSFPVVLTPKGGSWSDFRVDRIKSAAKAREEEKNDPPQ